MLIRLISESELDRFVAATPHPMGVEAYTAYIKNLWAKNEGWCFIAEEDGHITGRVAFQGRDEITYSGLYLENNAIGLPLFKHALKHLHGSGAKRLEKFINSEWENATQQRALLETLGVPLVQTKFPFTYQGQPPQPSSRLIFRTLETCDPALFIESIRRVTDDTLDRLDLLQRQMLGAEQHSQEYFDLLYHARDKKPNWWLLAYTPSDELVGHVIGTWLEDNEGGIGYIGVVPEQRGNGYIHDLLAQSMNVMLNDGAALITASTDQLNTPMINAFKRAGFTITGEVWVYHSDLNSIL